MAFLGLVFRGSFTLQIFQKKKRKRTMAVDENDSPAAPSGSPGAPRSSAQAPHSDRPSSGQQRAEPPDSEEAVELDCYPYTFSPLLLFAESSYFDKGYSNYNSVAQFFSSALKVCQSSRDQPPFKITEKPASNEAK